MLSEEEVKSFIALYRKHFGVDLPYVEASLRANNLMSLYEAVYGELLTDKDQIKKHEVIGEKI